jgi:hypothetical protein
VTADNSCCVDQKKPGIKKHVNFELICRMKIKTVVFFRKSRNSLGGKIRKLYVIMEMTKMTCSFPSFSSAGV